MIPFKLQDYLVVTENTTHPYKAASLSDYNIVRLYAFVDFLSADDPLYR